MAEVLFAIILAPVILAAAYLGFMAVMGIGYFIGMVIVSLIPGFIVRWWNSP